MIRTGVRATYKGRPGVITGPPSTVVIPEDGTRMIWHLVYDEPQAYGPPCGCCRPFGTKHRYRGVYTTTDRLVEVKP